jgi:mono/diheme cytochrome c family protein
MTDEEATSEGTRSAEAWLIGAAAGAVVLALLFGAYQIGFSQGEKEAEPAAEQASDEQPAAEPESEAAADPGMDLFVQSCGSCHVLQAAGTTGTIGPDLDSLAAGEDQLLSAIENGGAGTGQMPANLLSGDEAQQVAAYTASAAGG